MTEKQKYIYPYDRSLMFVVMSLLSFGLVMVFSASSEIAQQDFQDSFFFFRRQIFAALIGVALLLAAKHIPYQRYAKLAYPLLCVALVCLLLLFIPGVGKKVGGATRWLRLAGMSFQPSELAKLAMVIFLAYSLDKKGEMVRSFSKGYVPHLVVCAVFIALILPQPDLGMAVILGAITGAMLFVGGANFLHLALTGLAALPLLIYAVMMERFRVDRWLVFLDPWQDPLNRGFQIIHSFFAFGSGGLFGAGFGNGKQKLFYLPEPHTDFIFSVLGEEIGFIGVCVVLMLYIFLLIKILHIAQDAPDRFGYFLAMGIGLMVGFPLLIHLGVVLGLTPTKGMTLPLMSYGGSSLILNLLAMGILLNIHGQSKKAPKK